MTLRTTLLFRPAIWAAWGLAAILCVTAAPGPAVLASSQAGATRLEQVLRQMDAASAAFQNAQADLQKQVFTKVVNDTTEQKGAVYFQRKSGATQMGMKLTTAPQQTVEYKDGKVRVFNPGTNHVDEVVASGPNQSRFETFLTLGFGGSGRDLQKAWMIDDQGPEPVNDGTRRVPTEKLDLVSKDPDVRKNVSHVTVWIDPTRSVSLKQVLYFPNGDTQTATYTNIRVNGRIDTAKFAIQCRGRCS
ncbi:MAG: outer membrane lipoprotein-sorting protein [Acidobacteriota bacterium]|nr:outer membrane lipoprotein-sorting protein [Acidobacteriota bacterium]